MIAFSKFLIIIHFHWILHVSHISFRYMDSVLFNIFGKIIFVVLHLENFYFHHLYNLSEGRRSLVGPLSESDK
ncbi:hypothetical protein C0J52_03921 [Blattella germanica]|nr:hypothetical protein C0J52_03921 [Blattella germanica]